MLELKFEIKGNFLPSDHNYGLYCALCRFNPRLNHFDWQLGTINGIPNGKGLIKLGQYSTFRVRTHAENIPLFAALIGCSLLNGIHKLEVIGSQILTLEPSEVLRAQIVIIKGYQQLDWFNSAVLRKLDLLGINSSVEIGDRVTIKIGRFTVVGYGVCCDFTHNFAGVNWKHKIAIAAKLWVKSQLQRRRSLKILLLHIQRPKRTNFK